MLDGVLELIFGLLAYAVYGSPERPRPAIYRFIVVGTTMAGLVWWTGWLLLPTLFAPLTWWIALALMFPGLITFFGELEIRKSALGWVLLGITCVLLVITIATEMPG